MFETIAERLVEETVVVVDGWLPAPERAALARLARVLDARGALRRAGVGRDARPVPELRGDRIAWLDPAWPEATPVLSRLEALRLALNATLHLPLREVEAQLALYPPGARYGRHRDRFRDDDARIVSAVVYLNEGWQAAEGGALRVHEAASARDVLPLGGRLVLFRSDTVEHEVLPATRERLSVAAWFRRAPGV